MGCSYLDQKEVAGGTGSHNFRSPPSQALVFLVLDVFLLNCVHLVQSGKQEGRFMGKGERIKKLVSHSIRAERTIWGSAWESRNHPPPSPGCFCLSPQGHLAVGGNAEGNRHRGHTLEVGVFFEGTHLPSGMLLVGGDASSGGGLTAYLSHSSWLPSAQ